MKLSNLDPSQVPVYGFDEDKRAHRMTIVDGANITLNGNFGDLNGVSRKLEGVLDQQSKLFDAIQNNLNSQKNNEPIFIEPKVLEIPKIITETVYKEVNVPVIVKEIQVIEVPKELIIEKIVYKEIEKPIIIEKEKLLSLPIWVKICLVLQTLAYLYIALK